MSSGVRYTNLSNDAPASSFSTRARHAARSDTDNSPVAAELTANFVECVRHLIECVDLARFHQRGEHGLAVNRCTEHASLAGTGVVGFSLRFQNASRDEIAYSFLPFIERITLEGSAPSACPSD